MPWGLSTTKSFTRQGNVLKLEVNNLKKARQEKQIKGSWSVHWWRGKHSLRKIFTLEIATKCLHSSDRINTFVVLNEKWKSAWGWKSQQVENALYDIYALVVFVSENWLVRFANSFVFWYVNNSRVNTVLVHFSWSNLYIFKYCDRFEPSTWKYIYRLWRFLSCNRKRILHPKSL